jgi:hypothetical protein
MAKIEKGVGLWACDAMKEDINDRLGRMEKDRAAGRPPNLYRPGDWGDMQVGSQIDAMGMDRFEVGVLKDKRMSLEEMDKHEVIYNAANLRRLNVGGADIHIRPKEKDGYSLSLVDDVSESTLKTMKAEGFTPALVVRTSPGNYQGWMKHHDSLTQEVSSAAGRALAERFGADIGGAPAGHMGRLAGTTNRKEKHLSPEGKYPWATVIESSGKVYEAAPEFIAAVKQELENWRYQYQPVRQSAGAALKTIDDFRQDPRYGGDNHRIDFAYAIYASEKGVDRARIAAAIATRDLRHKGRNYVEYTIARAERKIGVGQNVGTTF